MTQDKARLEIKAGHKVTNKQNTAKELLTTAQIYPPNYSTSKSTDPYTRYIYGDPKPQLVDHEMPDWVKYDRMVLRYYIWFEDEMPESKFETRVIRKMILYYYLSDKTIHIGEPHEINSGMPQGVILSRRRIGHPDGHEFVLTDFMIGKSFWLLGREYHIVDVDDNTRIYYEEELGIDQGQPQSYPDRPYADELLRSGKPPIKIPVESIVGPRPKETLRQFLDYDRKVLRFTACWDDRDKLNGDKRCFIVHYYLSDDNVEVMEIKVRNDGRAPFPKLLRKMRLFKPEVIGRDREYYTDKDLVVGEKIVIYNRPMLLIDCDGFTREFYERTYRMQQGTIDIGEPSFPWPQAPLPTYTGFGSEEDSLASHYNLIPKPPRKDYKKMVECAKKILRFAAVLANPKVEDKDRKFIIMYYLGTDMVQIYEPPSRNSGFVCGKYLERGYYVNPNPPEGGLPRPFKSSDFVPGALVQFMFKPETERCSEKFVIVQSDKYTDKYWDGIVCDRPLNDIEEIILKFVMKLRHTVIHIKEVMQNNDPEFRRCLSSKLFYDIMARLGVAPNYLNEADVERLVNYYSESNIMHYDDFFDNMASAIPPEDSNHLDPKLTVNIKDKNRKYVQYYKIMIFQ